MNERNPRRADAAIGVAVFGATGRMGAEACRAVDAADGLELVGAVDPGRSGSTVGAVTGLDGPAGSLVVGAAAETLDPSRIDVAIDFTIASAARANLEWCASNSVHAVVGTTGLTDDDLATLRSSFTTSGCVVAANFAISAVLMMRLAAEAAPFFDSVEIIELHHDAKRDAPSGTSIATAQAIADASSDWNPDPTETEVLPGARGGAGPGGIPIHSVRLHGLVAHQEVIMGTTGQSLTIRQDSYDRTSFMPGVIAAVRAMKGRTGLTIGLDRLLFA